MIIPSSLLVAALVNVALAADCPSDQRPCVKFGTSCIFNLPGNHVTGVIGSYRPDCSGHCFQYDSFGSISAAGNGLYGTRCHVYSDVNCQNEILDTGNQVNNGDCHILSPSGKSMKCYYHC
ncbi:hypothetical protein OQA88_5632 [Cercophora sp. LCS_1]